MYSLWKRIWRRDLIRFCERIDDEFRPAQPLQAANSLFKSLDVIAREVVDTKGGKPTLRQRLERILMQAGVNFSLYDLVQYSVILALVFGIGVGLWRHNLWLALLAAIASASIPAGYVGLKWRARLEAMRHQLPDAFEAMARSLRAGQTLEQALQSIAQEFAPPLGPEFSYCFEQQNLGLPRETAYRELAGRAGLMEIQIMVVAILVQQQSGGNLAELLDKLAVVVRASLSHAGQDTHADGGKQIPGTAPDGDAAAYVRGPVHREKELCHGALCPSVVAGWRPGDADCGRVLDSPDLQFPLLTRGRGDDI